MMMLRLSALLLATLLLGCAADDQDDLRQWMKEATKDVRGRIPPLPQVKPYEPVAYAPSRLDPFNPGKIVSEQKASGVGQPDMSRPREPLEAYPLESLKYVGLLKKRSASYGVIQADSALYQVKVGNYMGQDFGVVVAISEDEIKLKELIQDAGGDWVERASALKLLEGKGTEGKK